MTAEVGLPVPRQEAAGVLSVTEAAALRLWMGRMERWRVKDEWHLDVGDPPLAYFLELTAYCNLGDAETGRVDAEKQACARLMLTEIEAAA